MFSSDSRWDRHLPGESYAGEEPLEVGAIFRQGKIIPKWFIRKTSRITIKEITYAWVDKRGGEVLYFFSVSDGAQVFQIYFNNMRLNWKLYQEPLSV